MNTHHTSKAQIVATIGPASRKKDILVAMMREQMDIVRMNFSWSDPEERTADIALIREAAKEAGKPILILQDLPGPRIQTGAGHTYDKNSIAGFTDHDRELVKFGVAHGVDLIATSFVGSAKDVEACKAAVREFGGTQPVIAKIERRIAVERLAEIVAAADAIMVARGDLGEEIPLEQIPFVQADIIRAAKAAGKPVITATQMMLSMKDNPVPTRAEVTDVANAILLGSDAVMLSEEAAVGKYPVETVRMMEKIVLEAEHRMGDTLAINAF